MEQANNQTTSEMYVITDQLDWPRVSMFVQEKFDLFHHHTSIRSIEKKTICGTHTHTKHAQYAMPNMYSTPRQIWAIHSRHTRQNKRTVSHTTTLSTTHKFGDTLHTCMHTHTRIHLRILRPHVYPVRIWSVHNHVSGKACRKVGSFCPALDVLSAMSACSTAPLAIAAIGRASAAKSKFLTANHRVAVMYIANYM